MDKVKEIASLIFGSRLLIEGKGRTFAKVPTWLAALAALCSLRLAVVTVALVVMFGMKASIVKA